MDYGDGKKDSTTNPVFSHTYTTAGTYTVSLTVIDAFGCKDIFVKDKAVIITAPKASFVLPDSISCKQSTLPITNTSSGLGLNYFWSFGDGGTSTDPNPIHSYTNEGYYNISLKVVDRFGCTDSISKTNAVLVKNAVAGFSLNDSIINCPPAEITFYNTSKFASSISWNFGDGNVSNVDTPIHYFAVAGTYRVKLVAKGFGSCADSVFKTVVVKGPSGSFTYNRISSCAPASINFSANAINKTSYTWDFGDGTLVSTTASNISHVYTAIGKYLPKLLLRDTVLGCIVTVFGKDTITVSGVTAGISKIPALYCDSATIQFADSSIAQFDAITSYVWNFGDGGTSNVRNPVHKYSTTGIFPVSLIVRTANGCIDTAKNLSIKIVKSPALSITGDKIICVDQSASFAAVVARDTSAITWFWDFANGVTSTLQSPPPQKFATAGNYSVYTRVTNSSGCIDTIRSLLVVNPLPSINAGEDSIICRGQSVTLTPSGGSSYAWAPNPTLSCTNCTNPVANTVVDKNVYVVTGTSALGCKATDSLLVTVVQPFSINTSPLDTLCKGDKFELWANGADNYTWSPSNGLSSTTISNPVAGPDVTTTYQVIGRDYRNCFADTAYIPVVVYPKPVFNIVQETINLAVGNSVTLNTTNSPDIIKWQWSPPAGLSCNNCAQPTASPVNSTTYRAVASNIAGCTGEDVVTINLFCNNGNVFVPNTFSPNGDGSNDVFFPRGKGIAGIRNLQVFNRYGQIVFQNKNLDINRPEGGWDGKFMGQPLNPDVFVYQMEVICETGEVFPVKGNVSLIR
jgi:gliding motility-associated-like protein